MERKVTIYNSHYVITIEVNMSDIYLEKRYKAHRNTRNPIQTRTYNNNAVRISQLNTATVILYGAPMVNVNRACVLGVL